MLINYRTSRSHIEFIYYFVGASKEAKHSNKERGRERERERQRRYCLVVDTHECSGAFQLYMANISP